MKTHIALGATLLLTLGSAVAGSFIYAQQDRSHAGQAVAGPMVQTEVTPEVIAMWKSTAASTDYVMPRRPI